MSQTKAPQPLDLGVVGNCQIASLINREGRHVWWCPDRFDQDPAFCALIDGAVPSERGFMDVELANSQSTEQHYLRNSPVLITLLTSGDGNGCQITDFAPRFFRNDRLVRPNLLIRRIEPRGGHCRIRIRVRPVADITGAPTTVTHEGHHLRYVSDHRVLRLTTDAPVSYIAEERWFTLQTPMTLILGPDEPFGASINRATEDDLRRTLDYWQEWVHSLSIPFEWQEQVIRAAITLKLCNFEETGAIVAALTTSISEAAGTGRNWDYRFCWLRDSYFTINVLNHLGDSKMMEEFLTYIQNVTDLDPQNLKPVNSIVPGTPIPEYEIPSLGGYLGQAPVRIGNQAESQIQNDSYGSVILAATQIFFDQRLPRMGGADEYKRLEWLGEQAVLKAFEPDAGLWEIRGKQQVHAYSSLLCWAACNRLANIALALDNAEREHYWRGHAKHIEEEILRRFWNPQLNSFVTSEASEDVDASLLLLPQFGFIDACDRRFLATLKLIEQRLRRGNHIMRYVAPDDFGVPENAFTICTFWFIETLCAVGREAEAREIYQSVLACCNHLGLLSEDIDPATGQLWGNFPQTYSMVGLILSAQRLSKSWEDALWRGAPAVM